MKTLAILLLSLAPVAPIVQPIARPKIVTDVCESWRRTRQCVPVGLREDQEGRWPVNCGCSK